MKKVLFAVIFIILLVIINDLLHSIYDVWQKKDFVTQAEKELSIQKQQNAKLKSELSYVQTPEFIEKEARNKLFMAKEGEQKVLVSRELESFQEALKKDNDPNWKKWWNLFFE